MTVRLILDGSILLETVNPSGDVGIILTSPHEKPLNVNGARPSGVHFFVVQVVLRNVSSEAPTAYPVERVLS
eukprot:CAMPEP_0172197994 /NCGR_PEP_ID=MMETSP1050-20130122/27823_1 /TAXON_ID=233186 /ORGANISM="Cryptomonas curvata, Strain CCAP979/52" /LENGTH=71 /DNA_ID=CAMNT_0012874731 /DNA_START=301 /DNA_END=512 /DNA_ORIENTATION=+